MNDQIIETRIDQSDTIFTSIVTEHMKTELDTAHSSHTHSLNDRAKAFRTTI